MSTKKYPPSALCTECGEKPVYSRHLCRRCYQRWYARKTRSADIARPEDPPRLFTDNRDLKCEFCPRQATHEGMCHKHYRRFWAQQHRTPGFWGQVQATQEKRLREMMTV
jgi:hypothetical protein